jgi:branched-chain amino acid transport system substrate-binding protein
VRARWLSLAALALVPAGCGGVSVSTAEPVQGHNLTIYSSLPLHGAEAVLSTQMVNGEKLALADVGGEIGRFRISYYSLDDSNPVNGRWEPGITATNAKLAAQDNDAIAYLGDYDSGATAVSLPLINGAGILQVSPGSPYVGLTSGTDAGQDEPARFYPSGKVTFGRLLPSDQVEAETQVALMRAEHVHRMYVLSSEDPFYISRAALVIGDAERAGIQVVGNDHVELSGATEYAPEAHKVAASGAQATFFSGPAEAGTVALWRALHAENRGLRLLGNHELANQAFTSQLGAAAHETLLSTPWLAPALYPPPATTTLRRYEARFHEPAQPYALAGYEAMSAILEAIREAGRHGNNRDAVIDHFFAIKDRDSVLGRYSMQPNGDTTLTAYGVDRVRAGRPVLFRAFNVPLPPG